MMKFIQLQLYIYICILQTWNISGERSWCDVMVEDEGWFRCTNRQSPYCVSPFYRCDNVQHCTDNSDEIGCSETAPGADHRSMETYCSGCGQLELSILNHHNKLRAREQASNMNELQWSKDAKAKASAQAHLCRLPAWGEDVHGNMDPDYSQNVARMYTSSQIPDSVVLQFIDAWYGEKEDYSYLDNSCAAKCGHYTVLVSAYARHLGCALVHCDRTNQETGDTKVFWNFVCNYSPGYNWMVWTTHPDQPYIAGEHCSACQPGLQCRDHLCA